MNEIRPALEIVAFVAAVWWGSLRVVRHLDKLSTRLAAVEEKTAAIYAWWIRNLIERGEDPLPFINAAKQERELRCETAK